MSLIIALGSNIGNRENHLVQAINDINKIFNVKYQSAIYTSPAVDYLNQPDFLNQVIECELPQMKPQEAMNTLLEIELKLGRKRDISKGPRTIDLDILFWDLEVIKTDILETPHPRWSERSFVVLPLQELPYFQVLKNHFIIPTTFNNEAKIYQPKD